MTRRAARPDVPEEARMVRTVQGTDGSAAGAGVSRRSVLAAGGVLIGGLLVQARWAPEAHAASADLVLEPLADDPVEVLTSNPSTVSTFPRQLGVRLHGPSGSLPPGTTFDLEYDGRVYAPLERPSVLRGGEAVPGVSVSVPEVDASTGVSRCSVVLDEAVEPGSSAQDALVIIVAAVLPRTYPYDLPRRPGAPTVSVPVPRAGVRGPRPGRRHLGRGGAAKTEALPWGVELAVSWDTVTWGEGSALSYPVPVMVSVRSTGPGPTPRDAQLGVRLDPRVVGGIRCIGTTLGDGLPGPRLRGPSTQGGTTLDAVWRIGRVLAPDEVLVVTLEADPAGVQDELNGIAHPVVEVSGPPRGPARQRLSPSTSVTRRDAVWSTGAEVPE